MGSEVKVQDILKKRKVALIVGSAVMLVIAASELIKGKTLSGFMAVIFGILLPICIYRGYFTLLALLLFSGFLILYNPLLSIIALVFCTSLVLIREIKGWKALEKKGE